MLNYVSNSLKLKTLVALSLAALILFNTLGFYGLLVGLRYKARQNLVQRLDQDEYDPEEAITLKLHLSVPYYMDDEHYERVNGEIEHQGEFYRLVKQKLVRDTLYVVCIKDHKSKAIKKVLTDYVKTFTDTPGHSKQQGKTTWNFLKDYIPSHCAILCDSEGWSHDLAAGGSFILSYDTALAVSSPPPRA